MVNITKHAYQRYAERIMDKTEKQSQEQYIATNRDLISERINTMIDYGEELFTGRVKEGNEATFYINGTWIILVDKEKNSVITLYKINLIRGDEEFNKIFANRLVEKIRTLNNELEDIEGENTHAYEELLREQAANLERIKEYESLISDLEQTVKSIEQRMDSIEFYEKEINMNIMHTVEDLVSKKVF